MGVTCAHEKWVTCAHHGSLAPIGGTEDIHTFRVRGGDMGFRGHGGHDNAGTWPTS